MGEKWSNGEKTFKMMRLCKGRCQWRNLITLRALGTLHPGHENPRFVQPLRTVSNTIRNLKNDLARTGTAPVPTHENRSPCQRFQG
jgi:hypothetical protein